MSFLLLGAIMVPSAAGCFALYLHARFAIRTEIKRSEDEARRQMAEEIEHVSELRRFDLEGSAKILAQEVTEALTSSQTNRLMDLAETVRGHAAVFDLRVDLADGSNLVPATGSLGAGDHGDGILVYEVDKGGEIVAWLRIQTDETDYRRHLAERRTEVESRLALAWKQAEEREQQYLLFTILVFVGVAGCSASSLGSFLSKLVLRRLAQLVAVCRRIGERDYGTRAETGGNDEITELAHTFNHMAQQIEHVQDRLEAQVRHRTEELHSANAELKIALVEAQEADRAKSEFLAVMSHELRTPLNGVLGMAQLLRDTELDEEQAELVAEVSNSGGILITIINDILDYTKVGAGKLKLEDKDFDLIEIIDDSIGVVAEKANEKDLRLTANVHPSVPASLRGDGYRLRQILVNLLGNAVKFTAQGGVSLVVDIDGDEAGRIRIAFTIRDTGIGIPHEAQKELFKPFMQADRGTTRQYGGTGLGLAICRSLVELMGGSIGVESEPGEGSSFRFTALFGLGSTAPARGSGVAGQLVHLVSEHPETVASLGSMIERAGMRVVHHPDLAALTEALTRDPGVVDLFLVDQGADPERLGNMVRRVRQLTGRTSPFVFLARPRQIDAAFLESIGECQAVARPVRDRDLVPKIEILLAEAERREKLAAALKAARSAGSTTHSLRIDDELTAPMVLVAEDNLVNQKVTQRMLEKLGYRVKVVADGLQAVEAARNLPIDAIIMDCDMPNLDGFGATRRIRELGLESSRLPIIALTASAMPEDRERCLESGMDDMLAKPIRIEALAEAISERIRANG